MTRKKVISPITMKVYFIVTTEDGYVLVDAKDNRIAEWEGGEDIGRQIVRIETEQTKDSYTLVFGTSYIVLWDTIEDNWCEWADMVEWTPFEFLNELYTYVTSWASEYTTKWYVEGEKRMDAVEFMTNKVKEAWEI